MSLTTLPIDNPYQKSRNSGSDNWCGEQDAGSETESSSLQLTPVELQGAEQTQWTALSLMAFQPSKDIWHVDTMIQKFKEIKTG